MNATLRGGTSSVFNALGNTTSAATILFTVFAWTAIYRVADRHDGAGVYVRQPAPHAPFDDVRWYRASYSEGLIGSCP